MFTRISTKLNQHIHFSYCASHTLHEELVSLAIKEFVSLGGDDVDSVGSSRAKQRD